MSRLSVAVLPVLLVCGGLAACAASSSGAAGRWIAPAGVTPAKQESDSRTCKRKADDYAMRRVISPGRVGTDTTRFARDPMIQADRSKANAAFRQYYTECMLTLGYTPKR